MSHPPEFTDTDPRAMEVQLDLLRKKTPGERLSTALRLTDLGFRFAEMGVRASHAKASDREVFLRVAARHLPRESMIRVYGWDPEDGSNPC